MARGLSLYLDLLRFTLALVVFLGHATWRGYTGHPFFFWFAFPYAQTAVTGFFVLSGFVIAHVTSNKEADPKTYGIARFSRLYSVILPALILTLVLDQTGRLIDPTIYSNGPAAITGNQAEKYLATLFMVHESWLFNHEMTPGTNGPFWSLGMEAAYYLIFGLFLTRRWVAASVGSAAVLVAAGWFTVSLFPCWLLGVALYHLTSQSTARPWLGAILFFGSAFALAEIGWARAADIAKALPDLRIRYAEAMLFAVNIFGAAGMTRPLELTFGKVSTAVRWFGSLTFALYLCHRPLLQFLTAVHIGVPGESIQHLWLFGLTGVVVVIMANLGEWLRPRIKFALALIRCPQRSPCKLRHGESSPMPVVVTDE